jgi:hypothetical protein
MINLQKFELEQALLTISTFNDKGELIAGLLKENISLGTKRKLQKIHKKIYTVYLELLEDYKETKEKLEDKPEELEKELKELLNESVKIDAEMASLASIESISTASNYNFDIIEKIAT